MFSITITASSTTRPMASDSPSSVKVFRVKPAAQMMATVPNNDIGMARSTLSVADSEPRNSQHTSDVSTTASTSSISISWIES
jgi:hypothetical protein